MIDFFLKIKLNGDYVSKPEIDFQNINYLKKYLKYPSAYFKGNIYLVRYMRGISGNSILENEDEIFFSYGRSYPRNDYKEKQSSPEIKWVYEIINNEKENYYKKIKGDCSYFIVSKNNPAVKIINGVFSTKQVFYYVDDEEIIVSSNISFILGSIKEIIVNKQSLVELSIFDYILGNKTYFDNIFHVEYGEIVILQKGNKSIKKYYDYSLLITHNFIPENEAIKKIDETFSRNFDIILENYDKYLLAVTGGFDGRLNLAYALSRKSKIISYTFGMKISSQIRIAKEITGKLIINYEPVYLDEDYENKFYESGLMSILLSCGYAPFMRANYFYSFNILSRLTDKSINGLFGSELIRPMHVCGGQSLNEDTIDIFLSDNIENELSEVFRKNKEKGFLKDEYFTDVVKENIYSYLKENYFDKYPAFTSKEILFIFYLTQGMRKFFMEELSIDKYFVEHFMPYLDIDLIEILFKSPFAGLYNGIFEDSPIKRRKGQLLYAKLLDKKNKILSNIITDRGFKPKDLLSIPGWLKVFTGFLFTKKLRKRIVGNDTFDTRKWEKLFFDKNMDLMKTEDVFYGNNLIKKYHNGEYLFNDGYDFSRHLSFKIWLNEIEKFKN